MTATDRANELAWAVQDGTNCLSAIRALRADPPVMSATELDGWRDALNRTQRAFAEMQIEIDAGTVQTSLRVTSDLLRSFADVHASLSAVTPGAQLSPTLFDLVDVAWSEFAKAMGAKMMP